MNFFGHAVAAGWLRRDPEFVLGAMLPDFASMVGDRLAGVAAPTLAAGVEHHHLTDSAFHRLAEFRARCRDLAGRLRRRGISRGPSLAAAHVGVELLLDGVLLERQPESRALFVAAMRQAPRSAAAIGWRGDGGRRFPLLAERFGGAGEALSGYRDPEVVGERVIRVLSRRPRLRLEASARAALVAELRRERPRVERASGALIGGLRGELGGPPPGTT